jgi:hypothetical protein
VSHSFQHLSRRDWLRLSAAGVTAYSMSGWLETLADDVAAHPKRKRSCILLWMTGGPSQMDTFDLKPGTANGGPYKEIKTSSPDLRISEHLPRLARFGDRMAVVRSMSTKEGEHGRATFLMRTGYQPTGPIQYPTLGSLVARELGAEDAPLPNFVSIAPARFFNAAAYGPGFLGPQYAPLIDWLMELPPALGRVFRQDMDKIQEEKRMPYVTSIERLARGEGVCLGIESLLRVRFGDDGLKLMSEIREIYEEEKLEAILKALETANRPEEVRRLWTSNAS